MGTYNSLGSGLRCQIWSSLIEHGPATVVLEEVSRGGAIVRWPECECHTAPKPGDRCRLELDLPGDESHEQRKMLCEGEVVRICGQRSEGHWRVAVRFAKMRFASEVGRQSVH